MALDLCEKEEEYRAINQQLQLKTKQLLEEANNVMKIQDAILKEPEIYGSPYQRFSGISGVFATSLIDSDNGYDNIRENTKASKPKEMAPFLRAKIKTMHCDYEKLQQEFRKKCDEVKKLQKEINTLTEEKERWLHLHNANKTAVHKLENQLNVVSSKLQMRENECQNLKKENEQIKRELKTTTVNQSTAEAKINKLTEELEKIKGFVKVTKQDEKDAKDLYKKQIFDLNNELKKNERNRSEFLSGYRKQLQLIDNLRKQKALLETLKFGEAMDTQFLKLLEWKVEE